jgi:hypothetical protein
MVSSSSLRNLPVDRISAATCDPSRNGLKKDREARTPIDFVAPDERYLFIDAICINQDDQLERSVQVNLMDMVYTKA